MRRELQIQQEMLFPHPGAGLKSIDKYSETDSRLDQA